MKYYYVSFSHERGFGAITISTENFFDIKKVKEYIETSSNCKRVVILAWQKISKEQLEAGI